MKYFFDTEFIEDGSTIDPLSIGIVREDGKTYYAEFVEADKSKASKCVKDNVLPHLYGKGPNFKNTLRIKKDIIEFTKGDNSIEFWANYCSYDWVLFCQIFGKMIDLPESFPMYCNDLQQLLKFTKIDKKKLKYNKNETEHNALSDALECKNIYDAIIKEIK